jgi:hypothetical protein
MKKVVLFILLSVMTGSSVSVFASVTLHYYNKDSVDHKYDAKMMGSTYIVKFDHSCTSDVTIQGGGETAEIITPSGVVKVKNGDKVEIKDGKVTVK